MNDRRALRRAPEWHTYAFAVAALVAALLTLFADGRSPLMIAGVLAALVPWALVAAGVAVPLWLFIVLTLVPVSLMSVVEYSGGSLFFAMLMVARVTSLTSDRRLIAAAVVPSALLPFICWFRPDEAIDSAVVEKSAQGWLYFVAGVGLSWLLGRLVWRQQQLLSQIQAAQTQLADYTRAEERRRIARDIHDIVAHSLTVVLLNVTGARKAMGKDPEAADEALARAEQVGRESLDGIREVVGLLRDGDIAGQGTNPLPEAVAIPALVEGYRLAGLDVDLSVDGSLDRLDPGQSTTLYRFVQEALTNARIHAAAEHIHITIAVADRSATARVANRRPPCAPVSGRQGLGLTGMRERVSAVGGQFTGGPEGDEWVVACTIPLGRSRSPR